MDHGKTEKISNINIKYFMQVFKIESKMVKIMLII